MWGVAPRVPYAEALRTDAWRKKLEAAGFRVVLTATTLVPENDRETLPPPPPK